MITLRNETLAIDLVPEVGGAITRLNFSHQQLFSGGVPHPVAPVKYADESGWVRAWQGGWQLAFPNFGMQDLDSLNPQSFHGNASQEPWTVVERSDDSVILTWSDANFSVMREIALVFNQMTVKCQVRNISEQSRYFIATEHLVLGGDLFSKSFSVNPIAHAEIIDLDYSGGIGAASWRIWRDDESWSRITPPGLARMSALRNFQSGYIEIHNENISIQLRWPESQLPYLVLWEESGVSQEQPWNSEIFAFGVEPSMTPHGLGLSEAIKRGEANSLAPGEEYDWWSELTFSEKEAQEKAKN